MVIRLVSPLPKIKATGWLMAAIAPLFYASLCLGQQPSQSPPLPAQQPEAAGQAMLTVPSGTRILIALVRPVSTKTTKPGDPVYLQTTFPVTAGDKLLIPAGTFLQGTLASFERHRNRVALQLKSAALIFSNGYTVDLLAGPHVTPGPDADIRAEAGHPKAAVGATVGASGGGTAVGAIAAGTSGAVAGGAIGGPIGFVLAVILLNHGSSVQIEAGSPVEITLDHPLLLDERQVAESARQPNRVVVSASRPGTVAAPAPAPAHGTCFTPEIPGTPPTIIPGAAGSPPTVIPGTPAIPGAPYPCP